MRTPDEISHACDRLLEIMAEKPINTLRIAPALLASEVLKWVMGYHTDFADLIGPLPTTTYLQILKDDKESA